MKSKLVSRWTAWMLLPLVVGVSPVGPLHAGRAVADSSDSARLSAIANAYQTRRAMEYTQLLQQELGMARYMAPSSCVSRQLDLIAVGKKRGFDGLESLALAYHDCAAASPDPALQKKTAALVGELARYLWFSAKPVPNLPQRIARRDTLVERGVEAAAVRSVLQTLVRERRASANMPLEQLLRQPAVGRALCDLPLRLGPDGLTSGGSLARVAMCEALGTPGGRGSLDDLCGIGEDGRAAHEKIGTAAAEVAPAGATETDVYNAADLAASTCEGGVGSGSLTGLDPFDAFSTDSCLGGDLADQAGAVDVAQLVQDCFSSQDGGYRDPAASDGDEEVEPRPKDPEQDAEQDDEESGDTNSSGSSNPETTGEGNGDSETSVVAQAAGAVKTTGKAIEVAVILTEAVAGEVAPTTALFGEVAGAVGLVVTVGVIAAEIYSSLASLSQYNRQYRDCWPNCHRQDDPEVGPATGGFDPQNEACQALVELGVVSPGAAIEESEIAPIAIIQPSPDAEDFASSNDGFCGADVGVGLDDAVRCKMDKDCGAFADLAPDCSCRPRTGAAAAWLAQSSMCAVIIDCPANSSVVSASGQCFCDSGDEDQVEGRWGQPGVPDPVTGERLLP